jgi:hypothetical protein
MRKGHEKNVEHILLSMANNLTLLGTLGLRQSYRERDMLVLEDLERNGVKTWMMSSRHEQTDIIDYNAIHLFENYNPPLRITGLTER